MSKFIRKVAIVTAMTALLSTTAYAAVPAYTPTTTVVVQGQAVEVNKQDLDTAAFVNRLYRFCLHREADVNGFKGWLELMIYGKVTARSIVRDFFNCSEFQGQKTDNNEFVKRLYNTCCAREGSDKEREYWVGLLENGTQTRSQVIEGFLNSDEFVDLCANFKVTIGK